jgi:prophage tail gpP-like protein
MVVTVLDQPTLNVPLPQPRPPDPTPQQPAAPSTTKPQELAVLTVNGVKFDDWESVTVQKRYGDPFTWFRFTAAERDPEVARKNEFPLWHRLQFKPGDACTVELAGIEAVNGWIEVRQVAYNATSHGVMLIGKSVTAWAARSSVDTKTGSFDGKNILQVAQEILAPYPVGIKVVGQIDMTPFVHLQNEKGELIWDFLERLARPRGIVMGSDSEGNFLLIGDHTFATVTELIEGQNIKSCQCTIRHDQTYLKFAADAQATATDDRSGSDASELHAEVPSRIQQPHSKLITPAEQPVTSQAEVQKRAENERVWHDDTEVQATITVQGWLCNEGRLWTPGDHIFVRSPMAMLNQVLAIQNATFTQDSTNGTETVLDMVLPGLLKGKLNLDPG